MRTRMRWMDVLRGAAIGLVILAHSAYILERFEWGHTPGWLIAANELFGPYRMPMLMLLSGMLVPAALRKSWPAYLDGKIRKIAWPYLVWLAVWCLAFPAYGSLLNLDSWMTAYVWFLLYLFAYYLLALVTVRVPTWLLVLVPWVIAIFPEGRFQRRFFFLMGFFFLGKLVAEHRDVLTRVLASRWSWAAVVVAGGWGFVSALIDPRSSWGALAPLSAVGVLAAIKLAQLVDDRAWTAPLQYVGRHSLVFYATHFPVITAVSWAGWMLGIPVLITVAAGFVLAILVGMLAVRLQQRTFAKVLFEFPRLRRDPVPALR